MGLVSRGLGNWGAVHPFRDVRLSHRRSSFGSCPALVREQPGDDGTFFTRLYRRISLAYRKCATDLQCGSRVGAEFRLCTSCFDLPAANSARDLLHDAGELFATENREGDAGQALGSTMP